MEEDRPDRLNRSACRTRYGDEIVKKYNRRRPPVDKQKAMNEQEVAKTEAETRRSKAQGEADITPCSTRATTDNVLKQHYIDAHPTPGIRLVVVRRR